MTRDWSNGAMKPSLEQLAAYADGELDAASRRQCADWLATHAEAAAEIDAWRRLARVWAASAPTEPGPAVWTTTLDRIGQALPSDPATPARTGRKFVLWASLLTASAAAVLAVSLSAWLSRPAPDASGDPDEAPYLVAAAHEVFIISMDVKDTDALVVGSPPVHGPLEFAAFEDIILVQAQPPHAGAQEPLLDEQLALPMILAQPAPWEGR
jgi:anti-sigma-K factor RskA